MRLRQGSGRRPLVRRAALLALACAALLAGCVGSPRAPTPPALVPSPTATPSEATAPEPIGAPQPAAGLFFSLISPALPEGSRLFSVDSGQPVAGLISLANYSLFDEFQIVCLVDYQQAPCVDSPLTLRLGEERQVPFRLPPSADGLHQVLFLVFYAPGTHSDSPQFRVNSRYLFAQQRDWLRVGPALAAPTPAPTPTRLMSQLSREARQGFGLFQLGEGRRPLNFDASQWLVARSGPQVALTYTALLTNPRDASEDFLLLPFLDFALHPPSGDPTAYFRVRPSAGAAIALSLAAALPPGPHELQVLAVQSPYAEPAALRGRMVDLSVVASARVLIQVTG